jgi:DNA-binding NarL/FixJ family response regulator
MPVTVSLVEDNAGLRESFAALLNGAPGLRCVGSYGTAEEAVKQIPLARPDVALVGIHLPGMNGIECVARLKAQLPELRILMLTLYEQSDLIFNSLRAGASGYLLKNTPAVDLIKAVEQAHGGDAFMSMPIARKMIDYFQERNRPAAPLENITLQEQKVLELLARGQYYREIGEVLGIGQSTVQAHLHSIYHKLHLESRAQLVDASKSPAV